MTEKIDFFPTPLLKQLSDTLLIKLDNKMMRMHAGGDTVNIFRIMDDKIETDAFGNKYQLIEDVGRITLRDGRLTYYASSRTSQRYEWLNESTGHRQVVGSGGGGVSMGCGAVGGHSSGSGSASGGGGGSGNVCGGGNGSVGGASVGGGIGSSGGGSGQAHGLLLSFEFPLSDPQCFEKLLAEVQKDSGSYSWRDVPYQHGVFP